MDATEGSSPWSATASDLDQGMNTSKVYTVAFEKMIKYIKKYVEIRLLLFSCLLSIVLNIYGLVFFLRSLAGGGSGFFPKLAVETLITIACYAANWPSILIRIYPYTVSQNGDIDYDIFGWQNLRISLVNTVGWYLIGLLAVFLLKKYRKHKDQ